MSRKTHTNRRGVATGGLCAMLVFGCSAVGAAAQEAEPQEAEPQEADASQIEPLEASPEREMTVELTVTGDVTFKADFDEAVGDVEIWRSGIGLGLNIPIGERGSLLIDVRSEYWQYNFSNATGMIAGVDNPFEEILRESLSLTFVQQSNDKWGWMAHAGGSVAGETGADFSNAFAETFGAGVRRSFGDDLSITLGAGVLTRFEEDPIVFPLVIVDWQINDQWRLTNDEGTGVQLSYAPDQSWTLTLDGGWEFREFRLDEDGALPEGIVTDQRIPIAAGLMYRNQNGFEGHVRAGAVIWQEFEVADANGNRISENNTDPTPFLSFSLEWKF